jgi:hypothetical protein
LLGRCDAMTPPSSTSECCCHCALPIILLYVIIGLHLWVWGSIDVEANDVSVRRLERLGYHWRGWLVTIDAWIYGKWLVCDIAVMV